MNPTFRTYAQIVSYKGSRIRFLSSVGLSYSYLRILSDRVHPVFSESGKLKLKAWVRVTFDFPI